MSAMEGKEHKRPDAGTQVRALLEHRAWELATSVHGVRSMENASYADVFTVSRADIDAWIAEHGLPHWNDDDADYPFAWGGIHLRRDDKYWLVAWGERGQFWDQREFASLEEARHELVSWILNTAGTGLTFS